MVPTRKLFLYTYWLLSALFILILNCMAAYHMVFVSTNILLVELDIVWRIIISSIGVLGSLGFLGAIIYTIHGLIKSYVDDYYANVDD